ncbi:unnamed protein product [Bursaphelenchus okinawaensis]|uniref:HhH-GPD domain-containing protein n=1 Tax=Bursaphelenchus okinawaensis TaxID=465554 RepID=A0A811KK50_9BILA|nr:unnamed protein product [Bursaphelenchus okinawaensis]CAG9104637.1 unnamed protein product [Bursaphelenchus okinawaensis]
MPRNKRKLENDLNNVKNRINEVVNNPKVVEPDIEDAVAQRPDCSQKENSSAEMKRFLRDYPLILKMRNGKDAPVDSVGCHMLADRTVDTDTRNFQTLTALILSPRVKDEHTARAMQQLKSHGLTVDNIIATPVQTIQSLISFLGLSQTKSERLKKCAQILHDQYGNKVPNDYSKLIALPGVGDKIASLVMVNCFDSDEFIGVDTHVHRITNMLKWVKTKTPKQTDDALKTLVPRKDWRALNVALVGMGQTFCKAVKPSCEVCLLNSTCPNSRVKLGVQK